MNDKVYIEQQPTTYVLLNDVKKVNVRNDAYNFFYVYAQRIVSYDVKPVMPASAARS